MTVDQISCFIVGVKKPGFQSAMPGPAVQSRRAQSCRGREAAGLVAAVGAPHLGLDLLGLPPAVLLERLDVVVPGLVLGRELGEGHALLLDVDDLAVLDGPVLLDVLVVESSLMESASCQLMSGHSLPSSLVHGTPMRS